MAHISMPHLSQFVVRHVEVYEVGQVGQVGEVCELIVGQHQDLKVWEASQLPGVCHVSAMCDVEPQISRPQAVCCFSKLRQTPFYLHAKGGSW